MKPGELIHVVGPVHLLVAENKGRFPRGHCVVIKDRETAMVDTGAGIKLMEPWAEPGRVDLVLNTHTHPDHTAGNYLFTGREILVPEQAHQEAGRIHALSERFAEPGDLAAQWRAMVRREMEFVDHQPTGSFAPDQEIKVGRTILRVIHAPGHTKDHCLFYLPQHNAVLSSDIDLIPFGPWYGHRESSLEQTRRSIEGLMALGPKVVVPAHRPPLFEGIDQALRDFLAVIDQRNERILSFLATERSMDQMLDAALIYGGYPYAPDLMRYWEGLMLVEHLKELAGQGRVQETERGWVATP